MSHASDRKEINIIKGQEAICPDGLGRVVKWDLDCPNNWIQISTYIDDRRCKWDQDNVVLIDPLWLKRFTY